jgi:hypothetical protein
VSVDGVGLHILDDHGWRLALATRSSIRDMLLLDGQLLVLSAFGVQRVDAEGHAETIAELDRQTYGQLGEPLALASANDRELWVAGALGVARHSGSWQLTPMDASNPEVIDLALDRASRPWLLFGSLFRHQEDRWHAFELDATIQPLALLADPRSEALFVLTGCQPERASCQLLRVTADAPPTTLGLAGLGLADAEHAHATTLGLSTGGVPAGLSTGGLPANECSDYDCMAVSPDGERAVIAGRCGLLRIELDGDPTPQHIGITDGWPGQPLRSLALDASGRVWAGTDNGLTLVSTDGTIESYPLAQLGDIVGPVGPIVIEGNGPPPPKLGRVRIGGLAGTLVTSAKDPLAKVRLELCGHLPPGAVEPTPERSPCAGVEPIHTTTTDDEGRFEFTGLQLGRYYFAVEIDGRWASGQPKAFTMRAGMTGNVGRVVVDVEPE